MSVLETKAATELKAENADVSPHKLISLLMSGAIERIEQTMNAAMAQDLDEKDVLWRKVIAIVNGLKESLNFDQGGDIAENLNTVYSYLLSRFAEVSCSQSEFECLEEAKMLITEVQSGWESMTTSTPEAIAC